MTEQDKKTNEREVTAERELAAFIKENRHKAAFHDYLNIAARSYIDRIRAALRCQQAVAL